MPSFSESQISSLHIDGLVQDCSNSIANALELLQSWAKSSTWYWLFNIGELLSVYLNSFDLCHGKWWSILHVNAVQGPLLLTWIILIPTWISNHICNEVWDEITQTFPKLQRLHRWSLGMDKWFHPILYKGCDYRQVSNINCTLIGNKIVDHSDVVGASPVGAAPTTSSFST